MGRIYKDGMLFEDVSARSEDGIIFIETRPTNASRAIKCYIDTTNPVVQAELVQNGWKPPQSNGGGDGG